MSDFREFIAMSSEVEAIAFSFAEIPERRLAPEDYSFAVSYYTDEVKTEAFKEEKTLRDLIDQERLLELRVFGKKKELYLLRTEEGFIGRIREDKEKEAAGGEACEIFDELHKVWTRCCPPNIGQNEKVFVRVRNYFNSEGRLRFLDSRCVDFENHPEAKKDDGR